MAPAAAKTGYCSPSGDYCTSVLIWKRHYPNRGAGSYRVSFFYGGSRLGPMLAFTQP